MDNKMTYKNKKIKKIIDQMGEGDQKNSPYERVQKSINKRLEILSRGGSKQRSHKKRVGNIVNKDFENRYTVVQKALKNIKEEYLHIFHARDLGKLIEVEIFKNPSKKEMLEVSRKYEDISYIRYIAHDNDFYVFRPDVLHVLVTEELFGYDSYEIVKENKDHFGTAKFIKGKWIFDGSDMGGFPPKYAEKYIEVDKNLKRVSISPQPDPSRFKR
jgi:hypothetical protein